MPFCVLLGFRNDHCLSSVTLIYGHFCPLLLIRIQLKANHKIAATFGFVLHAVLFSKNKISLFYNVKNIIISLLHLDYKERLLNVFGLFTLCGQRLGCPINTKHCTTFLNQTFQNNYNGNTRKVIYRKHTRREFVNFQRWLITFHQLRPVETIVQCYFTCTLNVT